MLAGVGGNLKSMFLNYAAVVYAVNGKQALIVDAESPAITLESRLSRFAQAHSHELKDLPIEWYSKPGLKFGKGSMDDLRKLITKHQPDILFLESIAAMLPVGREGLNENSSEAGATIRDEFNSFLKIKPDMAIVITAHMNQVAGKMSIPEWKKADMPFLVRGHWSIVEQGCDIGYLSKKISGHPDPTRVVLIPKARRVSVIPEVAEGLYLELKEQEYTKGWMTFIRIAPTPPLPSEDTARVFMVIEGYDGSGCKSTEICRQSNAELNKSDIKSALAELQEAKAIVQVLPFTYVVHPKIKEACSQEYLRRLKFYMQKLSKHGGKKRTINWKTASS